MWPFTRRGRKKARPGEGKPGQPVVVKRPDMPVLFLNLDRDVERLNRLQRALARQGIAGERIAGVLGSALPRTASNFIRGAGATEPGTLGCFLSHVRAWETLRDSGREGAIIVEDDIKLVRNVGTCFDIARQSGHHLVFLNHRMSMRDKSRKDPAASPLTPLAEPILARAGTRQASVGTDGYYLSREGAQILLAMVARHGVFGDVDWAVAAAAIGRRGMPALAANTVFTAELTRMIAFFDLDAPLLKAAALRRPMVRNARLGSSRMALNRAAREPA